RSSRRFEATPRRATPKGQILHQLHSTASNEGLLHHLQPRFPRSWHTDITYINTWQGWLYLATVIDLASRRIVGWAIAEHLRTDLVDAALTDALARRRPASGLVFHSDRGCQYTSAQHARLAAAHGVRLSVGRRGQCWDNAVAESFFSTIKTELLHRQPWPTHTAARQAIFEYIEGWYNTRRRHSSLGYLSPTAFEATGREPLPEGQAA
ncbi:MAG TPA: IS3 family transposase, partial [Catenuloplanes sp.]